MKRETIARPEGPGDCASIRVEECTTSIPCWTSLLPIYSVTQDNKRLPGKWSLARITEFDRLLGSHPLEPSPLVSFMLRPLILRRCCPPWLAYHNPTGYDCYKNRWDDWDSRSDRCRLLSSLSVERGPDQGRAWSREGHVERERGPEWERARPREGGAKRGPGQESRIDWEMVLTMRSLGAGIGGGWWWLSPP